MINYRIYIFFKKIRNPKKDGRQRFFILIFICFLSLSERAEDVKTIEDMQVKLLAQLDEQTNYCFADGEKEKIKADIMNVTTIEEFDPIIKRVINNDGKMCIVV